MNECISLILYVYGLIAGESWLSPFIFIYINIFFFLGGGGGEIYHVC